MPPDSARFVRNIMPVCTWIGVRAISAASSCGPSQSLIVASLGKALVGGKVGQKVDITLPMGKRKLKIVSLDTVHDLAERQPSAERAT